MPGVLNARPAGEAYLNDRCCLTCGYRGRELQGRRGAERLVCPRCRQDLYARPARTYAEMEGLVLVELKPAPPPGSPAKRRVAILRFAGGLLGMGLLLVRPGSRGSRRAGRIFADIR